MGSRGGPPGGGSRGGGPPGGGSPEDRMARFEGFLKSMDRNGNGVLEEGEVPEERRRMISGIAQHLGLEMKGGGLAISKIREAAQRRSKEREQEREKESGKSEKKQEPLVPGFGVEQTLARVPAFGERVEYASLVTLGSSSRSSASGSDPEREARMRGMAQFVMRRYDRNGSGALEKEEWGDMRDDPSPADRDKNGVITIEELTDRLVNRGRGESDRVGSNGSGSGSTGPNGRRSYRFLTAAEHLLEGLPDWFLDSDGNSDGQVAMAEYSGHWTVQRAREFDRYDRNHDGLITQYECLSGPAESETPAPPEAGPPGPSESPREEGPKKEESAGEEKPWWEL